MKKYPLSFIFSICLSINAYSSPTKSQLNQLEARMVSIKEQLSQDTSSRNDLYKKLANTEKKMSKDLHELHLLTPQIKQKKQEIQSITKSIKALNKQLKTQEIALTNHIRARHKLGAIHPWQWLLHQEYSQSDSYRPLPNKY